MTPVTPITPVPPVFELEGASFRYQETPALDAVSLAIPPGQCLAVLGANGSGKSTLLRLLAGLAFPHAGGSASRAAN